MLYLPNNRLKLETSTPKKVVPGATYNSTVEGAPPDTTSLQWKQQCWWLERTGTIIDAKFCGASELLSNQMDSLTNYRWCFPTGLSPVVYYGGGGSDLVDPELNYFDSDNTNLVIQKTHNDVEHNLQNQLNFTGKPCPLTKNLIYTINGTCYTRFYLVVGIYTLPKTKETNEYSVFQVQIAGNTAFDYYVAYDGNSFSFSNTRYRNSSDVVIPWPEGDTLFYDENSGRTRTTTGLQLDDLYLQNGGIDTTGYIKSAECKVVPGKPFYLCLLFDSVVDNASGRNVRVRPERSNSIFLKDVLMQNDTSVYASKITNNLDSNNFLYGYYVNALTNEKDGLPGEGYNEYIQFQFSVRVKEIQKDFLDGYVFRDEPLKEIILDPLCYRTVKTSQTVDNDVVDYRTSVYRYVNASQYFDTYNWSNNNRTSQVANKFCLSSNFTINPIPSDSVLWGHPCTLNYALSEANSYARYINVEYTDDEDMNYNSFSNMTFVPNNSVDDYVIDSLYGIAPPDY